MKPLNSTRLSTGIILAETILQPCQLFLEGWFHRKMNLLGTCQQVLCVEGFSVIVVKS